KHLKLGEKLEKAVTARHLAARLYLFALFVRLFDSPLFYFENRRYSSNISLLRQGSRIHHFLNYPTTLAASFSKKWSRRTPRYPVFLLFVYFFLFYRVIYVLFLYHEVFHICW